MYHVSHFTEKDPQEILRFLRAHPFVLLTGIGDQGIVATQVPVLIDQDGENIRLRGHIMRKTDHHFAFEKNNQVLAVFTGPQCYVSASWYSERGHGSTWNYMTVHARGAINLLDQDGTLDILRDLTRLYEDPQEAPLLVEHLDSAYISANLKAIAGFEIVLQTIEPVFKLSQNRDDESYVNIVHKLRASRDPGSLSIAAEMEGKRPQLF